MAHDDIGDDGAELAVLTGDACYRLLGSGHVGRLGVIAENYPLIIPVNYALDRDVIVIRSRPGTKLAAADHANVTFEIDGFDEQQRRGWSVLVRGQGEVLTDRHSEEIVARTADSGADPWAPGDYQFWLRIIPHGISGRRILPGIDVNWRLGTAAYM